jgi:hypothetical protein
MAVVIQENKVGLSCRKCLGASDNTQLSSSTIRHNGKQRMGIREKIGNYVTASIGGYCSQYNKYKKIFFRKWQVTKSLTGKKVLLQMNDLAVKRNEKFIMKKIECKTSFSFISPEIF